MITIKTDDSRIINNDGSLATGFGIVSINESFQYTDSSHRKKVSLDPIKFDFEDGILDVSFLIAPTVNASQDKTNLYYTVLYVTNSSKWTEYWVIDANGSTSLEITSVTQVIPSAVANTQDFISSDDATTVPTAGAVPRAKSDGTLDSGWFLGIPGGVPVYSYSGSPLPNLGTGVLGVGFDTGDEQIKVWNGSRWVTVGG